VQRKQNVGTAVFCRNSILLAKRIKTHKRKKVPFGGYWSIFSGRVEEGEDPLDAAYRELYEETKIIPEKVQKIRFFMGFIEDDCEYLFHTLEIDELITPRLNFEHTEYGWFKVNYLESFSDDLDDQILKLILDYDNERLI